MIRKNHIDLIIGQILARPRTYLALVAGLAFFAFLPALNVEADFDLEGFYPDDAETIVEFQRISDEFGRDDTSIIVAFRHDSLFTNEHLYRIKRLSEDLEMLPYTKEVRSLWNIREFVRSDDGSLSTDKYLSDDDLDKVQTGENATGRILDDIRSRMLNDPFVYGTFLGSDGTATAIYINLDEQENTFSNRRELISRLEDKLESYRQHYDINVTGLPYFRTQYVETLNREILLYVSVASLLIIIILWLLFRTVIGVLLPISIVWVTILFVVAVLVMTGGHFEIMSSTIAPILLCVGVADSIHMLSKYQDLRLDNKSKKRSLEETILVLGSATLLTSITTAIGFMTLMTSDVMPMRRFGLYTALGVLIAFAVTIFVLPSVLQLIKTRMPVEDKSKVFFRKIGSLLSSTHRTARNHYRIVVSITLLVTALFSIGITQLKTNSRVFDDIGESSHLIQQSRFLDEHIAPQFPLEIIIDTGKEDGAYDPDLLRRIEQLHNMLGEYDEISQSISFATLIKRVDQVMRDHQEDTVPDSRQLVAQYDLLLDLTGASGPSRMNDFENRQTRVIARAYDVGSYRINQMRDDLKPRLDALFPESSVTLTGSTILSADLTGNIVSALTWSIGLAFLFISVIMALLFRNAKLVIISLLPNLIPLIITAGFMGFAGIDIRPSTAVIFTIAFGIAVDDSIHYQARFRMETLRGSDLRQAVKNTTIHTGRAIILTSIILLAGFGVLGTSSFESNMLMGLLTCLTILTALLADLLFLPALIYWMNPDITAGQASALNGKQSVPSEFQRAELSQV